MSKHLGSLFDEFLDEEGVRAKVEAIVIKRVLAFHLHAQMKT
jgi:antitoxin HicB